MKVVINRCYGGFSVSKKVYDELGLSWDNYGFIDNKCLDIRNDYYLAYRSNKKLIDAIEKIGEIESSGELSKLEIVKIPDDIEWEIYEYDGIETIHEVHRTWG